MSEYIGEKGENHVSEEHDKLIKIETKLDILIHQFENHLKHHLMITIPLIGITGTAIVSLLIALLTK